MSDSIVYSNSQQFEKDVLQSNLPVILDFYSEDCAPCEALAPIFERLAEKYGHLMRFVKILRQQNRPLAEKYGVKSSPTILFFKNGQEVGIRLNGYINKPDLRKSIESVLGESLVKGELPKVECDVLILGGGPAGLSAAIYAGRARLNTVLVDEGLPGGQAATTYHIANYPGTPGTVSGKELVKNMREQAESFGVRIDDLKEVMEVRLTGEIKSVKTEDAEYLARAVVIATGAQPRKLPAEGEETFRGRGVHYCATCDGAMYQDQRVVVVGGGNSAVEEAVFLTRFAREVTIVHEFDHFQASKIAQEEAAKNPKIKVIWESHVEKVNGTTHVTGLTVKNLKTGQLQEIETDGIFVYIGTQPQSERFRGQLSINEYGYIVADEEMRTSIPGVFAAGDVRTKSIRQVITAASDGAIAGINAERYLAAHPAKKASEALAYTK